MDVQEDVLDQAFDTFDTDVESALASLWKQTEVAPPEPEDFDFINDGGWLENPLGDPNEFLQEKSETYTGEDAFDESTHVTLEQVSAVTEAFAVDTTWRIRYACIGMGIVIILLIIWVIFVTYFSVVDVRCVDEKVNCPPCPACPSPLSENLYSFYIRERSIGMSLFKVSSDGVKSSEYTTGSMFVYSSSEQTVRAADTKQYMMYPVGGGIVRMSRFPYEELPHGYSKTFLYTRTLEGESGGVVFVTESEHLCVSYTRVPFKTTVAVFKKNPNKNF